jgi:hypothetical protein
VVVVEETLSASAVTQPVSEDERKKAKEEAAARLLVARRAAQVQQYLEDLAAVEAGIQVYSPELSRLFNIHFGPHAFASKKRPPKAWKNFFHQVSFAGPASLHL